MYLIFLKDQSCMSVSNITPADIRMTTALGRGQFCNVIGFCHEIVQWDGRD